MRAGALFNACEQHVFWHRLGIRRFLAGLAPANCEAP